MFLHLIKEKACVLFSKKYRVHHHVKTNLNFLCAFLYKPGLMTLETYFFDSPCKNVLLLLSLFCASVPLVRVCGWLWDGTKLAVNTKHTLHFTRLVMEYPPVEPFFIVESLSPCMCSFCEWHNIYFCTNVSMDMHINGMCNVYQHTQPMEIFIFPPNKYYYHLHHHNSYDSTSVAPLLTINSQSDACSCCCHTITNQPRADCVRALWKKYVSNRQIETGGVLTASSNSWSQPQCLSLIKGTWQ